MYIIINSTHSQKVVGTGWKPHHSVFVLSPTRYRL